MSPEPNLVEDQKMHPPRTAAALTQAEKHFSSWSDRFESLLGSMSDLERESGSDWVLVDGIKKVPVGTWLVYLEQSLHGSKVVAANVNENTSIVGGYFAFDAPKVLAYRVQPLAPGEKQKPFECICLKCGLRHGTGLQREGDDPGF